MTLKISGTELANKLLKTTLVPKVQKLNEQNTYPKLVVILVGEHAASASYVAQKEKFAKKAGIVAETWRYKNSITEAALLAEIEKANQNHSVHGIIVQLPLPDHISVSKVLETIDVKKDVDGFTPENVGNLFLGEPCLPCCTPAGIISMVKSVEPDLSGKKVCVIGRSNIVGKPVAILTLQENATVKICHSRTQNLPKELADQDIIIVAVGRPEFLHGNDIPQECIVIDVGIHRKDNGKLCGDVHYESAAQKAKAISPVPGGVGPMTVYSLIENTIRAAEVK